MGTAVGFMPHFESLAHGARGDAAAAADIELIDPRGDPASIIAAIGRCQLLLSEAMHGAIVADALRVPWVALRPLAPVHRAKWCDWADALGMEVAFQPLTASSLSEWLHASRVGSDHFRAAGAAISAGFSGAGGAAAPHVGHPFLAGRAV